MSIFNLPDNGFNRYMAIDTNGVPQWESDFAPGTCESDAWMEFFNFCAYNECGDAGDYALIAAGLNDDDGDDEIVEKMQSLGWRMVECEPRPKR